MSLEEAVSETRLDNESILDTGDEAATISDAIIAAIDEVEAALSPSLELCWYTKYPMPPAAAAEELRRPYTWAIWLCRTPAQ
jgi:hypothetical protein